MKDLKIIRYPEADLLVFKKHIEAKIDKVQNQLDSLDAQLIEASSNNNQSDWVDDSSSTVL